VGGVAALRGVPASEAGVAELAAWSLVHGFATLWLNHALPPELGDDARAAAREVTEVLFRGRD
jgi:hypothetical protein